MMIVRMVYLTSVIVGLCINIAEYQHATWVCREAWQRKWSHNHIRQAQSFVGEEWLRVWVQAILIIPAVIGISLPYLITEAKRRMLVEALSDVQGWVALSIFAHITVAVLLAVKSIKHRRARLAILNVSHKEPGALS